MTDTKSPASSLPSVLRTAIEKFDQWTQQHLESEDNKNTIDSALYHYTDARGLKGIIESETIWFTDYRHLNDPSELTHGIEMARDVSTVRTMLDSFSIDPKIIPIGRSNIPYRAL